MIHKMIRPQKQMGKMYRGTKRQGICCEVSNLKSHITVPSRLGYRVLGDETWVDGTIYATEWLDL